MTTIGRTREDQHAMLQEAIAATRDYATLGADPPMIRGAVENQDAQARTLVALELRRLRELAELVAAVVAIVAIVALLTFAYVLGAG